MTAPGLSVVPQPGWWVRTERIGVTETTYGWTFIREYGGVLAGIYGWGSDAVGYHPSTGGSAFPYTFPYTLPDSETVAAADQNTLETSINNLASGTTIVPEAVSVSSASTLTLTTAHTLYVYSGSTSATWTLPDMSSHPGAALWMFNRSASSTVTMQAAGSDQILNQNSTVTSLALAAGKATQLLSDGSYWITLIA